MRNELPERRRRRNGFRTFVAHNADDELRNTVRAVTPEGAMHRAGAVAGWTTAAATIAMLAVTMWMRSTTTAGLGWVGQEGMLIAVGPVISAFVGAAVVDRRRNHPVGWLFSLSALAWGAYHLGLARAAQLGEAGQHTADVVAWLTSWTSLVAVGLVPVLVLYVFPTGTLASRRWRWAFAAAIAAVVMGAVGPAFAPGPFEDAPTMSNPFGVDGPFGSIASVLHGLGWPAVMVALAGGAVSLRQRAAAGSAEERQQIKWVLFAGVAMLVLGVVWGVSEVVGQFRVAVTAGAIVLPLLPVSLGIAILKHRLYDIDVLINRTLVYATLSAVLAGLYIGAVFLLGRLLSPVTADSTLAIAASTLAVAALFRPLRARIQAFIDRRFYRQKYNAKATVERFSGRLRDEVDLDALTTELVTAVRHSLQPAAVELWLLTPDRRR